MEKDWSVPILPLEPFVYPEELLTQPAANGDDPSRWWVLHTRPRAEKNMARQLLGRGLHFFLPLYQRQWRNKGRLFKSHNPLFPGYIFLRGDETGRVQALETNLVASCIPVSDQPRLHADLARVYRLMQSDASMIPEEHLFPGAPIEITSGPLAGLTGTVIRRGAQLRVFVEVQILQRGVSVEIESWMIEPARK
jgi:transcription antitermination factor NusG